MKYVDLTGRRFGRLQVIAYAGSNKHRTAMFECICDCGQMVVVRGTQLSAGKTKSCGCLHRDTSREVMRKVNNSGQRRTDGHLIHGENKTPLHNSWVNMKKRCSNRKYEHYDKYGGKGISVCPEWHSSYTAFRDWALSHGYQHGLEIDRINNDGDYEPSNCRWVTRTQQVRNRTNTVWVENNGERITLAELAERAGISYKLLHARYKKHGAYALGVTWMDMEVRNG